MNEEEDWVMRPVLEGMCHYESLIDGTLGLLDVARMNEAMEIRDENQARVHEAQEDAYRG
jgi:hypothetical protein